MIPSIASDNWMSIDTLSGFAVSIVNMSRVIFSMLKLAFAKEKLYPEAINTAETVFEPKSKLWTTLTIPLDTFASTIPPDKLKMTLPQLNGYPYWSKT